MDPHPPPPSPHPGRAEGHLPSMHLPLLARGCPARWKRGRGCHRAEPVPPCPGRRCRGCAGAPRARVVPHIRRPLWAPSGCSFVEEGAELQGKSPRVSGEPGAQGCVWLSPARVGTGGRGRCRTRWPARVADAVNVSPGGDGAKAGPSGGGRGPGPHRIPPPASVHHRLPGRAQARPPVRPPRASKCRHRLADGRAFGEAPLPRRPETFSSAASRPRAAARRPGSSIRPRRPSAAPQRGQPGSPAAGAARLNPPHRSQAALPPEGEYSVLRERFRFSIFLKFFFK